ncbi:hypothetical protein SORBI_3002G410800 [Sorghum bicolor]|uniref:Uncharacterized protein n=1 Tax=Sorghum bicolor TaxID=4558 RepID=A0A1W0W7R7_SORBI|nr:hypothetical protein SORBI_3002G410800 [Sorghum bicolor]
MSAHVCYSAKKAVIMASQVEDSAKLSMCRYDTTAPHPEGVISADTMHLTLKAYVDVFVHVAEDSYNRRVSIETVTSCLDALRGLVSISHILLDDALEAISWTHPREIIHARCVSSRSRDCNFSSHMVLPTILEGVEAAKSLLGLMAVRRQRALGKAKK